MHEGMPVPDYVFIIDVPATTSSERMKKNSEKRDEKHKFEKNLEFLEKVRQNYLKIPEIFPKERIIIVDGSKSIEEISEEIKKYFLSESNNI